MSSKKTIQSYVNGSISDVKRWLVNSPFSLGEFLDFYIDSENPTSKQIVRFVKRMKQY